MTFADIHTYGLFGVDNGTKPRRTCRLYGVSEEKKQSDDI